MFKVGGFVTSNSPDFSYDGKLIAFMVTSISADRRTMHLREKIGIYKVKHFRPLTTFEVIQLRVSRCSE